MLATYSSAIAHEPDGEPIRVFPRPRHALPTEGVVIRSLRIDEADAELRRIFALSLDSFSRNFLYTPIAESEFLEQNRRILPFVIPELVLLAEQGGTLVGFLFALPDVLQTPPEAVIIKTLAVSPDVGRMRPRRPAGGDCSSTRARAWVPSAIHALMHDQNVSRNISQRYARDDAALCAVREADRRRRGAMNIAQVLRERAADMGEAPAIIDADACRHVRRARTSSRRAWPPNSRAPGFAPVIARWSSARCRSSSTPS